MSLDCVSRTIGSLLCIANAGIFATLVGMATLSIGKHHGVVACGGKLCAVVATKAPAKAVQPARMSQLAKATLDKKI
jgi:hypothetical protein